MVIISGDTSSGSGALLKYNGKSLIFTNAHVLCGNTQNTYKLVDDTPLIPGNLGVAQGHDVAVVEQTQSTEGIEVMTEVDKKVAIGDEVVVLGNSKGAGVVTEIPGTVLGVGPRQIEVDAVVVSGNSGSPIIHVKTGQVIGLITHAEMPKADAWAKGSRFMEIRRYGVRLDTIAKWDFPKWSVFIQYGRILHQLEEGAKMFAALAQDICDDGLVTLKVYQASEGRIRQPVTDYLQIMNRHDMAPQSVLQAKQKFLRDVAFGVTANLPPVPAGLDSYQTGAFQKALEVRKQLKKDFEDLAKYQDTIGKITLP